MDFNYKKILNLINNITKINRKKSKLFGDGNSSLKFYKIIKNNKKIWKNNSQKYFRDYIF